LGKTNGENPLQEETEHQEGRPRGGAPTRPAQTPQPTSISDQGGWEHHLTCLPSHTQIA